MPRVSPRSLSSRSTEIKCRGRSPFPPSPSQTRRSFSPPSIREPIHFTTYFPDHRLPRRESRRGEYGGDQLKLRHASQDFRGMPVFFPFHRSPKIDISKICTLNTSSRGVTPPLTKIMLRTPIENPPYPVVQEKYMV